MSTMSTADARSRTRANILRCTFATAAVAMAAAAPLASAHGGEGYVSRVTGIAPATRGLSAKVIDGDERLQLLNRTGKEITILGYSNEPYLRIGARGVYENRNSPAAYLNDDRYGTTKVPAAATPTAAPKWQKVGPGPVFAWHDHRIHWMSKTPPPVVSQDMKKPHHVYDWAVPALLAGKRVTISGSLDYVPSE